MFQSNAYSQFKTEVREELRKVYDKQYEGLMRAKRIRPEKEYEEGLKRHCEGLKQKLRKVCTRFDNIWIILK
jgi:DNA-binding transcriptional regulator GbsR (MarR family)